MFIQDILHVFPYLASLPWISKHIIGLLTKRHSTVHQESGALDAWCCRQQDGARGLWCTVSWHVMGTATGSGGVWNQNTVVGSHQQAKRTQWKAHDLESGFHRKWQSLYRQRVFQGQHQENLVWISPIYQRWGDEPKNHLFIDDFPIPKNEDIHQENHTKIIKHLEIIIQKQGYTVYFPRRMGYSTSVTSKHVIVIKDYIVFG